MRSVEASEATIDVEESARVVEREQVLEPALDHVLLVVGGDHDGHARQLAALAHRPRAQARGRARGGG